MHGEIWPNPPLPEMDLANIILGYEFMFLLVVIYKFIFIYKIICKDLQMLFLFFRPVYTFLLIFSLSSNAKVKCCQSYLLQSKIGTPRQSSQKYIGRGSQICGTKQDQMELKETKWNLVGVIVRNQH